MNDSNDDRKRRKQASYEKRAPVDQTSYMPTGNQSTPVTPVVPVSPAKPAVSEPDVPADLGERRLGEFRLIRRLGRGGMAEVYLAEQDKLQRRVAVKVLRPEMVADDVHLKRFEQEARAAGGLNHPNIVGVYMIGESDGIHYIAQEYVQGVNLNEFLKRKGPPNLPVALHIIRQIAQALVAAGEAGIVHRDIKPENILITRKGEVKVADFGLAQLSLAGERVNLTQDGTTMGTPLYMSPEQVNGSRLDQRSDIYSLGVTCYHMLGGRPPFRGETAMTLAVQHVNEEPEPLSSRRHDLPPALCAMVHKMMAKSPEKRYADAAALLKDIKKLARAAKNKPGTVGELSLSEFETVSGTQRTAGIGTSGRFLDRFFNRFLHRFLNSGAKRNIAALLAACLAVGLLAAGVGFLIRPTDPLQIAPRHFLSEQPQETASDQYYRALKLEDDEQAWRAVIEYFPDERTYTQKAREQLARIYLQEDRYDEAETLFTDFVDQQQNDSPVRARGYAGLAIISAMRGDHQKSHRIITGKLVRLAEHLDENTREVIVETITHNRNRLSLRIVRPGLEERFAEEVQSFPQR